ncbi:MAG TPA: hypothetical protein VK207_00100 [Bacteroidales bacterium]|nr:hypothetical protein [Bacteroidales bacterium]
MSSFPEFSANDSLILSKRGTKNRVDPEIPYAFLAEKERTSAGKIADTAVIFLTGTECPFRCLMCDLWKNTINERVKPGNIPRQIEYALTRLPHSDQVKLYNSGSFFDRRAVPPEDFRKIAGLMEEFETVVVESHPAFIGKICVEFGRMLKGRLEIAIGLETIHPELVKKLNKKMSPELFSEKVSFLVENGISARAFILLRPPFLSEKEGVHWAKKSIDFAFDSGVECCTVIPVRPGNGTMDELLRLGYFTPPKVNSLEKVLEYGIKLNRGRVFADTWDLKMFSECDLCLDKRTARITEINLSQEIRPLIHCNCRS